MKLDSKIFIAVAAVAGISLAVAADMQPGPQEAAPLDPAAAGAPLPEGHPDISGATPQGGAATTGVVEETIRAQGYTYVRLTTDEGEIWVAGPETDVAEGEEIRVVGLMNMGAFESTSLGRTFDPLYFTDRFARAGDVAGMYTGVVAETIPVSRYIYVRVRSDDGADAWLAAPEMEVAEGDQVAWPGGTMMRNFNSSSLERTFDEILFVTSLEVVPGA